MANAKITHAWEMNNRIVEMSIRIVAIHFDQCSNSDVVTCNMANEGLEALFFSYNQNKYFSKYSHKGCAESMIVIFNHVNLMP